MISTQHWTGWLESGPADARTPLACVASVAGLVAVTITRFGNFVSGLVCETLPSWARAGSAAGLRARGSQEREPCLSVLPAVPELSMLVLMAAFGE